MSIILKEYCGYDMRTIQNSKNNVHFKESAEDYFAPKPDTLMVEVEGIHAYPFYTRNFTRYMPEALKKSQKKWTSPYLKPLIKHHNDQNGEIIGRIYDASYTEQTSIKNVGGLVFTVSVPDKKAEKEVEDRLLETVSIGVSADDVRCSICGSRIINAEDGCPEGHTRGCVYENETCYWDIYDIEPKELSYVIVPSDIYAKNVKVYRAGEKKNSNAPNLSEAFDNTINKIPNNGGSNPNMDAEKELADAREQITKLQADLEAANTELETLKSVKEENEVLKQDLEDIKKIVEDKDGLIQEVEEKLRVSEEDLATVQHEKELAENTGLEAQESLRSYIETSVNVLRKLCNKTELEESELKNRSIDSLKDSFKDLKEEVMNIQGLQNVVALKEQRITNPVPPKNEVPPKKQKQENHNSIDLGEEFKNLFTQICK